MRIEGRCHCGNLGFELETERTWETIGPRECDCSFCRAHATRCVSDPAGRAAVFVADPDRLVRYQFGLRTADFLVCGGCGVYIGAYAEGRGSRRALDPEPPGHRAPPAAGPVGLLRSGSGPEPPGAAARPLDADRAPARRSPTVGRRTGIEGGGRAANAGRADRTRAVSGKRGGPRSSDGTRHARRSGQRLLDPRPLHRLSEQRDPDVAPDLERPVPPELHHALVGLPVARVVDGSVFPLPLARAGEPGDEVHTQEGPATEEPARGCSCRAFRFRPRRAVRPASRFARTEAPRKNRSPRGSRQRPRGRGCPPRTRTWPPPSTRPRRSWTET